MIEIGIDEAGYGPLLGPLVVTAWGVSRRDLDDDLWDTLEGAVSRGATKNGIVVADSKQVYSRRAGLRRLEESVLTFLSVSDINVSSYDRLIETVVPEDLREPDHLWCDPGRVSIPLDADAGAVEKRAFLLRSVMERHRVGPAYVASRLVSPRRFNRGVGATGNKQSTLFSHVASLIRDAASRLGKALIRVTVDKIGSTRRYGRFLEEFLPGWTARPQSEERARSTYCVSHPGGAFELSFVRKGDQTEFLVALSSMQSKYLREIEMRAFNGFWNERLPGVAPTAGYYTDGRRFVSQVRSHAERLGLAESDFIRVR